MTAPTETYGLSLPDLQDIVASETFAESLTDAISSNILTGFEAGFAVYNTPHGPSETTLLRAQDSADAEIDEIDLAPLMFDAGGELRKDLGLIGHTHGYALTEDQLPSDIDLLSFEALNRVRPGVIDAVASLQQNAGIVSLFLVRGRESEQFSVIRRPFNTLQGAHMRKTLRAINRSGAVYHMLEYDFQTGRLLHDPADLRHFYEK